MGCIAKGQKLDKKRLKREKYPLPELGDGAFAWIRALSAAEGRMFVDMANDVKTRIDEIKAEAEATGQDGERAVRLAMPAFEREAVREAYRVLALCMVDDAGEPIYDSAAECEEDFAASYENVNGMYKRALLISGVTCPKDPAKN